MCSINQFSLLIKSFSERHPLRIKLYDRLLIFFYHIVRWRGGVDKPRPMTSSLTLNRTSLILFLFMFLVECELTHARTHARTHGAVCNYADFFFWIESDVTVPRNVSRGNPERKLCEFLNLVKNLIKDWKIWLKMEKFD